MSVPFIHTKRDGRDEIVVIVEGISRTVLKGDGMFEKVREALVQGYDEGYFIELFNDDGLGEEEVCNSQYHLGRVEGTKMEFVSRDCDDYALMYDDTEIADCLRDELQSLIVDGLPYDGMVALIQRLYDPNKRVSYRVRNELLSFIKRNGIVVDTDGCIIAYKAVKEDYYDKYTGKTFKNVAGAVISMDFGSVNDNAAHGCGKGLHAGSLDYVSWFGGGDDRIVVVRIDPSDVVSVPSDCDCQKLRTCRYTVVGDYQGELKSKVYEATDNIDDMYDYDYDGEDYYDEDEDDDYWDDVDGLDYHIDNKAVSPDSASIKWVKEVTVGNDPITVDMPSIKEVDTTESSDSCCGQIDCCNNNYGIKPSGHKFYNRRGSDGRFSKN